MTAESFRKSPAEYSCTENIRIEEAVKLYSKGKLTIGEASDLAGVSVGEMLEMLSDSNVKKEIGTDDVGDSLRNALEGIG